MSLNGIAAMGKNRVIGNGNKIPWNLKKELQFFKQMTLNKTVIMGRKTYESLGKPLPNRINYVISKSLPPTPGVIQVPSIEDVLHLQQAWVIGGAEIYKALLPYCNSLFLTILKDEYPGDTFFPEHAEDAFTTKTQILEEPEYEIFHLTKIP